MSSDSLQSQALNSTNEWRSRHMAEPVQWNDTLAEYAHDWAKGCVWEHSGGPHGENLAAGFENATLAIDAWGNEEEKYNYKKGKFTEETGHFSQLVWRNTTSIGCAEVECDTDGDKGVQGKYLVCEYNPAGNVQGQFKYNVMKSGMDENGNPGFGSEGTRSWSSPRMLVLALAVGWVMVNFAV
ncbi:uncharacterized protein RHO25_012782 [Cercospora beticola]|uniref:SCP domain-containing protein n=1 Tax=Cercospora beticola TaxID=122368 RepID=A0ABZ0P8H9_CERBT|nr:hypothetical protein RHO25_012782 [Cercospora beticola]